MGILDQAFKSRCALAGLVLGACFAGLIGRLVYLQAFKESLFERKAENQHRVEIVLEPRRGEISDAKGRILAMSVPTKTVFAVPADIEDPAKTIEAISRIVPVGKDVLEKIKAGKTFVYVKRKLDPDLADRIKALKLRGIYFQEDSKRKYPKGELLCHVLGFVGVDDEGLEGLELRLDNHLRGAKGKRMTERDATGREILPLRNQDILPQDGCNVTLTVDEVIQHIAETELALAVDKFHPVSASILVIEPATGDILAMANLPHYDPNNAGKAPEESRRNRAITDFFEPGSTFKMVTAAGALNEKIVSLDDTFFCENGKFKYGGRVLNDHHPYGSLTVQRIIEVSSNIGVAKIGMKLGETKLYEYIKNFGFGQLTGIPLAGEVTGISRPPSRWSKLSITRIPMGQEIAATPLQTAMAYAAIANKGVLMKPRIIKAISDTSGRVVQDYPVTVTRRVLREDAVKKLIVSLKGVVGDEGTAAKASVDGYTVAGKTGTAQKVDPDGRYSHRNFYASFVGFVPAQDPQLLVMVAMNEPKPFYYGGTVAAPVFSQVAERTLKYMEIGPDKETRLARLEGAGS